MIYTIGESVLDIIVKDFDNVKLRPGGAMLNTAISLGRLGMQVGHISFVSSDISSDRLISFLHDNSVNTDGILRLGKKTNLALAFLNASKDAEYIFYKEELATSMNFDFPSVREGDIILFGSFFSLNPAFRVSLIEFLKQAKQVGALVIYDPNFRKAHLNKLDESKPYILENFSLANIVKASDEDFMNMFGLESGEQCFEFLDTFGVEVLLYTKGSEGSECYTKKYQISESTPKVNAISTIGAGDTFSAGIIYSLQKNDVGNSNLSEIGIEIWSNALVVANKLAAQVCETYDNYIGKLK